MERFKSKVGQNVTLLHSLQFLDSFEFMSQCLDSLAKTVNNSDFKLLRAGFSNIGDNLFERLTKKNFVPYNYQDCFEKFNAPFSPHSPLRCNISRKSIIVIKEQHNFALGVYNASECKNLGDYHDTYLRTDMFPLADIPQKFREVCMQVQKLDLANLYSAPNLT